MLRVEKFQIVHFFAYAREDNGQGKFGGKGEYETAFCRTVKFGQDDTVKLYRLVEYARLVDGVLPRRRVLNEQF